MRADVGVLDPDHPPPSATAWRLTWVVLAGAFCISFTITILSVSRPTIAKDLGADPSLLVWLISGPTMAMALSSATAGKLGDVFGHRRTYLLAMAGSAVFAVLSAVAWSASSLIAARVLGAAIGAASGPSSMAIINLVFPRDQRSKALGYWSLVVAGGPVVGLVAGGPLVQAFGWRMIFVMQVPLLLAAGLVAWRILPETPRRPGTPMDVPGQLTLAVGLLAILIALDRGRPWGWTHPAVIGGLLLGIGSLVWFVRIEQRSDHPLVPLRYFQRRTFTIPVAIQFFTNFGYMGGFILAPKLLSDVRGLGPSAIALMLIPRPLIFAVSGPVAGALVPRVGTRFFAFFGAACMTLSLGILAVVSTDPSTGWVVLAIAISGIGMGSAQPAIATSVANSVDHGDLGVAGASQQLVGQVGSSLGMNLLDSIQVSRSATIPVASSFGQTYAVGAVVSAVGMVLAMALRGRRDVRSKADDGTPKRSVASTMDPAAELP